MTDRTTDNLMEVTDFNDPALDVYARMTENQLLRDPSKRLFIA